MRVGVWTWGMGCENVWGDGGGRGCVWVWVQSQWVQAGTMPAMSVREVVMKRGSERASVLSIWMWTVD